ncbi:hypothetical protein WJX81_007782 [Elliptochloris bilobata]|uniref:Uncharacterized protein n=1 Tax=Elliptochloris bilobata TaxID=381761 RepID=A0AAW1QZ91_9CHLO
MSRLWAVAGLLCVACRCADGAPHLQRQSTLAPAFLWSESGQYFAREEGKEGGRVAYAELPAQDLMGPLLGQLLGVQPAEHPLLNPAALQQSPPKLVVVVLSGDTLARGGPAVKLLKAALQAGSSRVSLPNVAHLPAGNLSAQALATAAGLGERVHTLGACAPAGEPATPAALEALLARAPRSDGVQAVVVCVGAASAAEEAASVAGLQAAASADTRPSAFLYAVQPQAARVRARSLLSAPGQSYVCDAKCETQVRLLEAFILSVTLISALLTGTCMLHMLCTPTRFEAPKGERAHGDS